MPDKKPTDNLSNNSPILSNGLSDNEKAKALECCIVGDCDNCPYDEQTACKEYLLQDAINELNRLQAENERLQNCIDEQDIEISRLYKRIDETKAEAYKEFAEKLESIIMWSPKNHISITAKDVRNILQGLVGDNNDRP